MESRIKTISETINNNDNNCEKCPNLNQQNYGEVVGADNKAFEDTTTTSKTLPNDDVERVVSPKKFGKYENIRITKNVVIIGIAFMIHFTAFNGMANLQSTINSEAALGTVTLAVTYGALIVTNLFFPVYVIRWFGCKWTIPISFIAYMPIIIAQFYPRFYTLVPAALGIGIGGGPLWCAKSTYLTVAAEALTSVESGDSKKKDVAVVRYFGLFFVFYQMAQVWGNLISSSVLSYGTIDDTNVTVKNVGELCGVKFCPGVDASVNPNLIPPDPAKVNMLSGIFLGCMVLACFLVIFGVDSLRRYGVSRRQAGNGLTGIKMLALTLKLLSEKYQLLLLPISMFIGAEEAFVAVDYTAAFVACGWGISRIGYAMICFGAGNAFASGVAGLLAKLVGRLPIMVAVFILHSSLLIWMHEWVAIQNDYISYCIMAGLWGFADGIWLVNVNAFNGILFPGKEIAAYSNFRLWKSTGAVIGCAVSSLLCTSTKLLSLLGLMIISIIGYLTIEVLQRREKSLVDRSNVELVEECDKPTTTE